VSSFGQSKIDFATVDAKTYSFYQNAQWDSLIVYGKRAQKQGVGYYYLSYRMGVAYFYKHNYWLASYYFQQALDYNSEAQNDDFFAELYHLALVYSQRNDLALDMPLPRQSETPDPMTVNNFVLLAGGGRMINFDHSNSRPTSSWDYSELKYQDAVNLWSMSYRHQFNSRFKLGLSYTNLHFLMKTMIVDEGDKINKDFKISQYSFTIIPEFSIGLSWQIKPVIAISSNKGFPYSIVDTINGDKVFDYWDYKENNILFGVNVYRYIKKVKLGCNFGISNYSNRRQAQLGANLTYFPFGNLNLYTYTAATFKVDDKDKNLVFQQNIGFKVLPRLWMEAGAMFGELKNYNDLNLGFGYNIADYMDILYFGKLIIVASESVNFFIEGQYIHKYTYEKNDYSNNKRIETRINYDQWNIEGGLLWNF
jgi:hypothetical protein